MDSIARFISSLCVALVLTGCAAERHSDPSAAAVFQNASSMDVSATEYRVCPPDKLGIRAPGMKELEVVTTIRPDGKISTNLLGEFYVAGKTPKEIEAILTAAASRYYSNATLQVEVAEFNSKFYTIFGTAVRAGGRKAFTGRDTVVSALASAGFTENAWPQQVSISRPAHDGKGHTTAIVDMKALYMTGDTTQNYLLEEGDVIYVPDSPLYAFAKNARNVLTPLTAVAGTAQSVAPAPR